METQKITMDSDKVSTSMSENRKTTKPVMEKRRRARINASLSELKSLLLDVIKSEGVRQNKMEKADILEMTVRHLRLLQRQQYSGLNTSDPAIINKYQLGFNECTNEVNKYLGTIDGLDTDIRTRLLNHLADYTMHHETRECNNNITNYSYANASSFENTLTGINKKMLAQTRSDEVLKHAQNVTTKFNTENKHNIISDKNSNRPEGMVVIGTSQPNIINSIQAIPTQMPSGEMAFLIPAANMQIQYGTAPNYVIPVFQPQNAIQVNNQPQHIIQTHSPIQMLCSGHPGSNKSILAPVISSAVVHKSPGKDNTTNTPGSSILKRESLICEQDSTSPATSPLSTVVSALNTGKNVVESSHININEIIQKQSSERPDLNVSYQTIDPMWRPW